MSLHPSPEIPAETDTAHLAAPAPQAPVAAAAPAPAISAAAPIQAPAAPQPVARPALAPAPAGAPVAARPSAPATAVVAAPRATVPTPSQEPLAQHDTTSLQIDVKRDQVTSSLNGNATSVNGEMLLRQGIQLAGTHYGLNLISMEGVIVIPEGARILPSRERPSRIIAQKIVIAGEAVIERLQADQMLVLAPSAKAVIGEIVYGKSFVTHDGASFRITKGARQLTPRERRVANWFEQTSTDGLPADQSGFDAFCRAQDAELEANFSENLVDESSRGALPPR